MDDVRRTRPIEVFLKGGGTFAVLRPVPDALTSDRAILSLRARAKIAHMREAAMQKDCVDLVLIPRGDETSYVTVNDLRWPRPVFVNALALPPLGTRDGDMLTEGRAFYGDAPLERYLSDPTLGDILHRWAQAATIAIEHALVTRMIHKGRVVICGGEPFTRFLASHLLPSSTAFGKYWDGRIFESRVYEGEGFLVRLDHLGHVQMKPLFPTPTRLQDARRSK